MKRKVMMLGLAMVTGLPHAVCARETSQAYPSWNTSYFPHYGAEGAEKPLMDHASVASPLTGQGIGNTWRLEFTPLPAVSSTGTARDIGAGFTLKLDF